MTDGKFGTCSGTSRLQFQLNEIPLLQYADICQFEGDFGDVLLKREFHFAFQNPYVLIQQTMQECD